MKPDNIRAPLAGVLATAVALGVAELVAGLLPDTRSLVLAVGDLIIDSVPGWLERQAIAVLGTADKPVLIVSILLVSGLLGAALGLLAMRRLWLAVAGLTLAAGFGVAAALADPRGSLWGSVLVGAGGATAGAAALVVLTRAAKRDRQATTAAKGDRQAPNAASPMDRRRFLRLGAAAAALAVVGAVGGRLLAARGQVQQLRQAIKLPIPATRAPTVPPGADLEIPGLTPLYVPNERFFRIDTALTVPQVDPADWSLQITGLVDRPFSLTYPELLEMSQIEADITLACVSNEVGGHLVGNARWQGVPLYVLLERAGLQAGATQLVGRSVDGFTAGFPTVTALDVAESMVALGMNGEPLPAEHGFPARLVVPGLYGYVSATKWLSEIQLTGWDDFEGYWIPRGWAKEGPIKTQSRIDVPAPRATIPAGPTTVAGVAWAPTRGIERVEVRVDDGEWQEAELAARLDVDCWRQWALRWDAPPGRHLLTVRATDGRGEVQTDQRTPVAPDGASGHHTIAVVVGT